MFKDKQNNNQKGFTLMEVLVVLAIFSVFMVLAIDLILTINRVQRETRVSERVLSESRFILNTIASEVRGGTIDYEAYGDPADPEDAIINPADELIVVNQNAERVRIKGDINFCPSAESTPCLLISRDDGISWASMTPIGVRLLEIKFIINPDRDPFYFNGIDYLAENQPMVTTILRLENTEELGVDEFVLHNQTTISERAYGR